MTTISLCRTCLASNIKMYNIANTQYQEIFEKVATKLQSEEEWCPPRVCYVCAAQLQRWRRFAETARRAGAVLAHLHQTGLHLSEETLNIVDKKFIRRVAWTPVVTMSLNDPSNHAHPLQIQVKQEIKQEPSEDEDLIGLIEHTRVKPQLNMLEQSVRIKQPNGFKEEHSGFKEQHSGFKELTSGYKEQHSGYKEQHSGYKEQHSGYKEQHSGYKEQHSGYKEQHSGYKEQHSGCIEQHSGYKEQHSGFKEQHSGFKEQHSGFKEQLNGMEGQVSVVSEQLNIKVEYSEDKDPLTQGVEPTDVECNAGTDVKQEIKQENCDESEFLAELEIEDVDEREGVACASERARGGRHACEQCGKSYAHKYHLYRHMRMHSETAEEMSRQYTCEICGKAFLQNGTLTKHLAAHAGRRRYHCAHCPHRAAQKDDLARHMLTHTGARPFACEQCGARFARRSNMVLHARTHAACKPHACAACGAAFARRYDLRRHVTRRHTGEKAHACPAPDCGFRSANASYLGTHIRKKHAK